MRLHVNLHVHHYRGIFTPGNSSSVVDSNSINDALPVLRERELICHRRQLCSVEPSSQYRWNSIDLCSISIWALPTFFSSGFWWSWGAHYNFTHFITKFHNSQIGMHTPLNFINLKAHYHFLTIPTILARNTWIILQRIKARQRQSLFTSATNRQTFEPPVEAPPISPTHAKLFKNPPATTTINSVWRSKFQFHGPPIILIIPPWFGWKKQMKKQKQLLLIVHTIGVPEDRTWNLGMLKKLLDHDPIAKAVRRVLVSLNLRAWFDAANVASRVPWLIKTSKFKFESENTIIKS